MPCIDSLKVTHFDTASYVGARKKLRSSRRSFQDSDNLIIYLSLGEFDLNFIVSL